MDTRYFHLYSSTATAPTMLVPQNDIQIGNRRFTSGFKIPVEAKVKPADNFNQTIIPQSSSEYAVHTWYYNQQTKTWSIGDEAVRYPDHEETVALAAQSESGVKLGKHFTITVTKPADNDQVDYQFISAAGVKNALEKSIISHYENYNLDPVIDASNTYVTRKMISTTAPAITVKRYSDVRATTVRWLWYPYIAVGKITLLQGDPGDGKSTMMMSLISAVSNGGRTPAGKTIGRPQRVIYQCSEDGVADTIKPRLERCGADCRNIGFINEEVYGGLTLDDERIRQAIISFRPQLVVVDPIQAYLGNDSDLLIAGRARDRKSVV